MSMRTIKFRAWDTREEKMDYDPEYNSLSENINDSFTFSKGIIWMQFTGLLDKNGKEIYEGDIVLGKYNAEGAHYNTEEKNIVVEYDKGTCGFFPFADYDVDCGADFQVAESMVVGNIYENPDLLK